MRTVQSSACLLVACLVTDGCARPRITYTEIRLTEPPASGRAELGLDMRGDGQADYLEIFDGNLEEVSFRCDANVSIRPKGTQPLGTRTELKNLNSFKHVEKALQYEINRQKEVLLDGGQIVQETRLWDPD